MFFLSLFLSCSSPSEIDFSKEHLEIYPAPQHHRARARHILISYQDAWKANTHRSKTEAKKKIMQIAAMSKEQVNFGELALHFSEDPTKTKRGDLGIIEKNTMLPAFEEALFALDINEISDIVETGFGFHLIQRQELEEAYLSHIVIQWNSCDKSSTNRSKEEAISIANSVSEKLAQGENPKLLAKELSDGPFGSRGGELGWLRKDELNPDFVEPIFALSPHECTNRLESRFGFHFFCLFDKSTIAR